MKHRIEKVLGSSKRLEILNLLSKEGPKHVSGIANHVNTNYTSVLRHLELLKENGLVFESKYGKMRIFEIAFDSLELSFIEGEGLILEVNTSQELIEKIRKNKLYYVITDNPIKKKDMGETLRNKVKAHDGHKCVICGLTELQHIEKYNRSLTVHHINEDKTDHREKNLKTLCIECHIKTHKSK